MNTTKTKTTADLTLPDHFDPGDGMARIFIGTEPAEDDRQIIVHSFRAGERVREIYGRAALVILV